jgi:hypothetical protein
METQYWSYKTGDTGIPETLPTTVMEDSEPWVHQWQVTRSISSTNWKLPIASEHVFTNYTHEHLMKLFILKFLKNDDFGVLFAPTFLFTPEDVCHTVQFSFLYKSSKAFSNTTILMSTIYMSKPKSSPEWKILNDLPWKAEHWLYTKYIGQTEYMSSDQNFRKENSC